MTTVSQNTRINVIVWTNSQTGKALKNVLSQSPDSIILWTSRQSSELIWSEWTEIKNIWLELSSSKSASSISTWVEAYKEVFKNKTEIILHLHAMTMQGIDENYPENIVTEIQKVSNAVIKVFYISYEDGYDADTNPNWSCVSYNARQVKQNLEASVKRIHAYWSTIIDLIVFDSPSAKVLGPTHVGVVWDFFSYITQRFWKTLLPQQWTEFITQAIAQLDVFLAQYPLRWPLKDWQQSMKDLEAKWEFQTVINSWTKQGKLNFWNQSFLSWKISEIYLLYAMKYLTKNETQILQSSKRVLLDWNTILETISDQEIIELVESIWTHIQEKIELWKKHIWNQFYKIGDTYFINPLYVINFNEHMGIWAMMFQHDLLLKDGIISNDEDIISVKSSVKMYAWEELQIVRTGNNITISNARNSREVFSEAVVWKRTEMKVPTRKKWLLVDRNSLETSKTLSDLLPNIPHREWWAQQFLNGIPESINGVNIDPRSAILENIGFKVWAMMKTQQQTIIDVFPTVTTDDLNALKWMFWSIKILYLSSDYEEIITSWQFDIEIEDFKIRSQRWERTLILKLNMVSNNRVIGTYQIIWI